MVCVWPALLLQLRVCSVCGACQWPFRIHTRCKITRENGREMDGEEVTRGTQRLRTTSWHIRQCSKYWSQILLLLGETLGNGSSPFTV
jgi:hypothetical protein